METPGKEGVIGLQVPHSQHFVFSLTLWNKLECYIALGWKVLPVTNTLAFWPHTWVAKKKVNTTLCAIFAFGFFVRNGPNQLECLFPAGLSGIRPSLMFVRKAGAYPRLGPGQSEHLLGVQLYCSLQLCSQTLDEAERGFPETNTPAYFLIRKLPRK